MMSRTQKILGATRGIQTIAALFEMIETQREALEITDYSVSQTTMEDVFLSFAEKQERDLN